MLVLTILSILLIASYVAAVCVKSRGVPSSISATFYTLDHKLWFLLAMWGTAGLLMPVLLETSKPGTEFLAFLASAGMLLVGAAPHFKDGAEGKVHTAGAVMCLAGSQIWAGCHAWWVLVPAWLLYLICTAVRMTRHVSESAASDFLRTKPMFWVEVVSLAVTYVCLFMEMI